MNRFSIAILKIFLLGFSLVLGLTILEVAAKMISKTTRLDQKVKYVKDTLKEKVHTIGCYDPYLGWGYLPNSSENRHTSEYTVDYSINSKGFRDKEISMDKALGEFRIVALGESTVFAEGIHYGKRFTEIIENALENVEVMNMGVWGFGADQSLLQLERDGFQFKPDAVILFGMKDFFERCKLYQRLQAIKPRFVLNDNKDDIVLQDINFIKNKLMTSIHSETSQHQLAHIHRKSVPSFLERSSLFTLLKSKMKILEINRMTANDIDRLHWERVAQQLEADMKRGSVYNASDLKRFIFLVLKRYQEICKKNSTDFILVYIDTDKKYFLKYFAFPCRDLGVKYIDLSDMLLKASNNYSLRFNIDPHYNEFAHQVIGEYVSDYLAKKYNLARKKGYVYKWLGYFN